MTVIVNTQQLQTKFSAAANFGPSRQKEGDFLKTKLRDSRSFQERKVIPKVIT